ncbi:MULTISPECIES: DUF1573 domain-containing protein [Tenacibaculum]|uniref:DUF1573 domain-containing protein n=1 Tax=Tenacibaculum TaxID=104267 RepID=UPI001F0AA229|nr:MULTISPECIES: DUF1573 domain-containing protein [Tenacibaculum]MCH3882709.1 DUF1573 domain-containing protein [Tenacibaculum aquimarinum]MCH3884888.1 DUF1573 domain-containing protein [Tenacibaculum aquimarinum]MDO6600260.1 DUF1573 domain-containing protein [Tenacibaculum sp. 1_MG-2023]
MKLVFTLFFVGLLNVTMNAQEFKFEKELINYGKIAQGSEGKRVFEFTNIGEEPIIITRVSSSCGCTIPKKPEQPIMPGETGKIEVSYDTKRLGGFSKTITIFSNAKTERKKIKIKGYISKEILPEKEKSMLSDS